MPAEINESAARPSRFPATSVVLFLLCLMYAINYIVRVDVSTAASVFQPALHLSNTQVGLIFSAFAYSYLIFQIIGGWISDRLGARLTLTIFAVIWSAATICMGLAHGLTGMLIGRVVLGLGVSSLPTATRALAVWMPAGKRAFAQGITHSSARLGNALTPPLVAWLITLISWRGAFVVLGIISLAWAIAWAAYYRDDPKDHPQITQQELETLAVGATQRGKGGRPVPWVRLIRRMLPVTIVYFCYGWTIWFLLSWIPQFFLHSYKLKLNSSSLFATGVFLGGVAGDLLGGIVSDRIFEKTGDRKKARRNLVIFGFLCSLVLMLPILFFHKLVLVAVCLSAAFFFCEFTVGPMWAIPMDIAPQFSGSASGLMNTGSALAGIISPLVAGYIIDKTGSWELPFIGSIGLLFVGAVLAFWMKPQEEIDALAE